jgi:hypothetical protein
VLRPVGGNRNWSFSSTGFDAAPIYVVGVAAMLGATAHTDLALDPHLPQPPATPVPTPIAQKAGPAWSAWWEASVSEYRGASRDEDLQRSMATCEALAGSDLSFMLNRVRQRLMTWLGELHRSDLLQHSASHLVAAAESAQGKRARDFSIRYDLLPVAGPIVLVVSEDPAGARSRLLIPSGVLRTPGRLDRILADTLDRVAF